jgi:hypothetical protein
MNDGNKTTDGEDICDRDSVQIRLSISRDWIESELVPAYPHVTTVSQAARTALMDGVEAATEDDASGVEAAIGHDVVAALDRLGGEVENCQSVTINAPENVEIAEVDDGE